MQGCANLPTPEQGALFNAPKQHMTVGSTKPTWGWRQQARSWGTQYCNWPLHWARLLLGLCLCCWEGDTRTPGTSQEGAKTINVFWACLGAQLTICAQKWCNLVCSRMVSLRFVLSRVCVFLYSLGPRSPASVGLTACTANAIVLDKQRSRKSTKPAMCVWRLSLAQTIWPNINKKQDIRRNRQYGRVCLLTLRYSHIQMMDSIPICRLIL